MSRFYRSKRELNIIKPKAERIEAAMRGGMTKKRLIDEWNVRPALLTKVKQRRKCLDNPIKRLSKPVVDVLKSLIELETITLIDIQMFVEGEPCWRKKLFGAAILRNPSTPMAYIHALEGLMFDEGGRIEPGIPIKGDGTVKGLCSATALHLARCGIFELCQLEELISEADWRETLVSRTISSAKIVVSTIRDIERFADIKPLTPTNWTYP